MQGQLKTSDKRRRISTLNATGRPVPGTDSVLFVDQNVDPGAVRGVIDADRILGAIRDRYEGQTWGMLDFEVPYDNWIGCGFGSDAHRAASSSLVALMRIVRAAFPTVSWTYYGIPGLSYWPGGRLWVTAPPIDQMAERSRQIMNYARVMAECDWLAPCVYDIQRNDTQRTQDVALNAKNELSYRLARIQTCRDFLRMSGTPHKPVIPCVCPLYCAGGNVPEYRLIPPAEYESDQIAPCREAADGVCIWLAPTWMIKTALSKEPSPDRAAIREMIVRDMLGGSAPDSWPDAWPDAAADVERAFDAMLFRATAEISGGAA